MPALRPATALLVALFATAGCTKWVKPGATEFERDATKARCDADSRMRAPPVLERYMSSAGGYTPQKTRCNTDSRGRESCTTTGGDYRPPTFSTRDLNDDTRDSVFRACMYANGWRAE